MPNQLQGCLELTVQPLAEWDVQLSSVVHVEEQASTSSCSCIHTCINSACFCRVQLGDIWRLWDSWSMSCKELMQE